MFLYFNFKNFDVQWLITGTGETIHNSITQEQCLKILVELSNTETLLEMETSLIQIKESFTDLRRKLFLSEFGINKGDTLLKRIHYSLKWSGSS